MSLKLYQRHRNLEPTLENTYYDDTGRTIYMVHTPFAPTPNRTTTISKALYDSLPVEPSSSTPTQEVPPTPDLADDDVVTAGYESQRTSVDDFGPQPNPNPNEAGDHISSPELPRRDSTNFIYIAQIDWRLFKSSKIRFATGQYDGKEVQVKDLFRKQGWGWMGRHRIFTGEDGKEYQWRLGRTHSELTSNGTLIATFHQDHILKFSKKASYLEIFPQGQHMVDDIFITFTYIERLRKVRQRAARN